jgi:hypothetical protein
MINNTSVAKWDRIAAKSLDQVFQAKMIHGLNCSPFEAEAIVEQVHLVYSELFASSLLPGQILRSVIDISVPPQTPLKRATQRLVVLTLDNGPDDLLIRKNQGITGLRQERFRRMAEEAFQQGGLLTIEDLSLILNCGVRTLVLDLKALRIKNIPIPLRSTVKDMGRAVTHRALIISLWLSGLEYSDIVVRAHHCLDSIRNYVEKFKRCVALSLQGFDLPTISLLARLSTPLAVQFLDLYQKTLMLPRRREEIESFLKKTAST